MFSEIALRLGRGERRDVETTSDNKLFLSPQSETDDGIGMDIELM